MSESSDLQLQQRMNRLIEGLLMIDADEIVYSVRDNGVGFPTEQGSRLFNTLRRLHSQDEFEGSGIRLATVQRIVQRHGGRVLANGEVGGGAEFYFALSRFAHNTTGASASSLRSMAG